MKKLSLTQRVLVFLKGGDEAKLQRFEGKLDKYFEKQIKNRTEAISNLEDKITDAQEELNDAILQVDVDRINKTEGAEDYCVVYVKKIKDKADVVGSLASQIDVLKEEIGTLNDLKNTIYSAEEKE